MGSIEGLDGGGDGVRRHVYAKAGLGVADLGDVARVAGGVGLNAVDASAWEQLVFIDKLNAPGHKVFVADRIQGFKKIGIQVAARERFVIAAPHQAQCPSASGKRARVRDGCGGANDVAGLIPFRMGEAAGGELRHPILVRRDGEARGVGVHGAPIYGPAVFAGLGSIEAAGFEAHPFVLEAGSDDVVGDVRRILPMMANGRLRKLHRGGAVRIGDGSQRGVAHGRIVEVQHYRFADAMRIVRAQPHHEIVRMLAVDQRDAVGGLAGLKELRVATAGNGGGYQAQHGFKQQGASEERVPGRAHDPIGRIEFVSPSRAALLRVDEKSLAHHREEPASVGAHQHWHRCGLGVAAGARRDTHQIHIRGFDLGERQRRA